MVSTLLLSIPAGTINAANDQVNLDDQEKVIVNFKENASERAKEMVKRSGKVKEDFKYINAVSMEIETDKLDQLKKDSSVGSVEPDLKVSTEQTIGYGQVNVNASEAWTSGLTGKGIRIGVIDSGAAMNHPDLIISGGQSFVDYTTSYADDNGHGTHVAGIVSAENNDIGVVGLAPDSDIYALKSLDQNGSGYVSDIIEAIDWSIENDMDIINMSLGMNTTSRALEAAVNKAYADGILLTAAAGNEASSVDYPAKYSSVIAVSATNETNGLAYFSNFGREIEVSAPGSNILSTSFLGDYVNLSGTSMATPYVSGQIALLKELHPTYTSAEIREELHKNVLDLGKKGKDSLFGYGLIQVPVKSAE